MIFWSKINLISGFVVLNLYSIIAKANPNIVYGTIIESEHYVVPKDPAAKFDKNDYYAHPEKYTSNFHEKVKSLTIHFNYLQSFRVYTFML
jgi:hypothetical protein